jgi:hypothetical protein
MAFTIPIQTVSEANRRDHWAVKAKRVKQQRSCAILSYRLALHSIPRADQPRAGMSLRITLTRVGPRRLDSDNLASAGKAARDVKAEALEVDDGSPLITWVYAQRRGAPGEYGVEVLIQST